MEREPGGHQDVSRTMRWGESDVDFLGGVGVGLVSEGSSARFQGSTIFIGLHGVGFLLP